MIKEVAIGIAGAFYEQMMHDNEWYKAWKDYNPELTSAQLEYRFQRRFWWMFIEGARATLSQMLASNIPEDQKSRIYDALQKDHTLERGRARASLISLPEMMEKAAKSGEWRQ
jgi:hypothetical protein